MDQKTFIERYNSFFGENIDSLDQIVKHTITGDVLIEFTEYLEDIIEFEDLSLYHNNNYHMSGQDLYNFIIQHKI
jgi:hypothetical protein